MVGGGGIWRLELSSEYQQSQVWGGGVNNLQTILTRAVGVAVRCGFQPYFPFHFTAAARRAAVGIMSRSVSVYLCVYLYVCVAPIGPKWK